MPPKKHMDAMTAKLTAMATSPINTSNKVIVSSFSSQALCPTRSSATAYHSCSKRLTKVHLILSWVVMPGSKSGPLKLSPDTMWVSPTPYRSMFLLKFFVELFCIALCLPPSADNPQLWIGGIQSLTGRAQVARRDVFLDHIQALR